MNVETSWGRLLRGHYRGGLRFLPLEAFFSFFARFAAAPMLLTVAVSPGSLAARLFLQFSRRLQVAVATLKGEGR